MNKKALLIGINDYSKVDKLKNLNGCKNDLIYMYYILNKYSGFNEINILSNHLATSANIKMAINNLISSGQSGDNLLIYFTGHGSHVYDLGGGDEYDGLDEVLCSYDMDWGKNYVSDDFLWGMIYNKLHKDVHIDIILDSCFSGGMLKGENENVQNKYLEMPIDKQPEFDPERINTIVNRKIASNYSLKSNVAYWLSCGENEKAGQGFNSIIGCDISYFTFSLCRNIDNHKGQISRQALSTLIQQDFSSFNQTPKLLSNNTQKLFERI